MRQMHAVIQVERAEFEDNGDIQSASAKGSLFDFYTSGSSQSTEEPPKKKRRLTTGQSEIPGDKGALPEVESVVLAQVTLDLRPSEIRIPDEPICSHNDEAPLPVVVKDFEITETYKMSILLAAAPHRTLRLVSSVSTMDDIFEPLEYIAKIGRRTQKEMAKAVAHVECLLLPPNQMRQFYQLQTRLKWKVGLSPLDINAKSSGLVSFELGLLKRYLRSQEDDLESAWSFDDFYHTVHIPQPDQEVAEEIQKCLPKVTFYPFQSRAVDWLLRREGVRFSNGELQNISKQELMNGLLPPSFSTVQDASGRQCYVSQVRGMVSTDLDALADHQLALRGGILAEEMGLGKTVELIALISLHKRTLGQPTVFDAYSNTNVRASRGTLIITPRTIFEQWKSEINAHAPHLSVFEYHGMPPADASEEKQQEASVDHLLQYDVVLTTYGTLAREIHYADTPPDRNMRHAKKFEARRSPLVQISWWRVCLDEAQMVESGVSKAATVARNVPRINAWAVSGTPFKKNVQDLRGLLIFLHFEPFASGKVFWDRMDKPTFKRIFGTIAMRHTKEKVRDELRLPPQKRMVITVPFTPIEEQNYAELVRQMCDECGVTEDGSPAQDSWSPDDPRVIENMRKWLARLRQTCLHPQVGGKNRRALGKGNGPLRTVDQVLQVMIEQNETLVRAAEREYLLAILTRGHIWANAKSLKDRARKGLEIYQIALRESKKAVEECRKALEEEIKKVGASADHDSLKDLAKEGEDQNSEKTGSLHQLRTGLRHALEVHHACLFFTATAYYQIRTNEEITDPESEEFHSLEKLETEFYDKAKAIRKELLQESRSRAEEYMQRIRERIKEFSKIDEVEQLDDLGGIENRKVLEKLDWLTEMLNGQTTNLNAWRDKAVEILLLPLVDQDESGKDITGEEYDDSTKAQDELYVYVMALRAAVADRHHAVTGQFNRFIKDEMKRAVTAAKNPITVAEDGTETLLVHAPELTLELLARRDKFKLNDNEPRSLRGIVSELRALETNFQYQAEGGSARGAAELAIIRKMMAQVQDIFSKEMKILSSLENDMELFRVTMNLRLEFYRQLQHISDSVAPYREELDEELDQTALGRHVLVESKAEKKLAEARTKQRFLFHLRNESTQDDGPKLCVICQTDFELGVLTVCGHQYCKDCIRLWWNQHHSCPICKRHLRVVDFHEITYKPQELKVKEENHHALDSGNESSSGNNSPLSGHTSIYTDISNKVMDEIKSIDLNGSFGTKIDTIARHILWIRQTDGGSKSIIFSQFGDFLNVLADAFNRFKIGFSRIGAKNGIEKFRNDPSIECFLLDATSDSSGLNLVNATHVFLCEPLINAAIELQAIARVHRIGQHRATAVYMYLVNDTVEEAIYDISVSRRLAHMGRSVSTAASRSGTATPIPRELQENAIEVANSLEMQKAPLSNFLMKKKGEGEVVNKEDLWNCLFSKPRNQKGAKGVMGDLMEREVGRHLRAEAAEGRMRAAEAAA